ncbi:T cell receptor alpha variable 38-2/delta variable 8, partial [Galemys pyrenaicus]
MAKTVTQPQREMSGREAENVTLNCTYDTTESSYYLFWYKQPPSREMIFLIRQESFSQQNATNNRFSVNFQKTAKSFSLRISDSQLEDAALYFCAFSRAQRAADMACPGLLWTFTLFTCLGCSMTQTVTQPQREMSGREAENVTLNCTYDTTESRYNLFWYKQPPSGEMILLIRQESFSQQNATNNRFSVNFQKTAKSFSLRISDSQLEDAALYFCAFRITGEVKVEQSPPSLSTQEGENYTIYCNYSSTILGSLRWYRQDLGRSLESLFSLTVNGMKQEGQLTASLDTKARLSTLHFWATQQSLSATYFCAVDTQWSPKTFSLHKNLGVPLPLLWGLQ